MSSVWSLFRHSLRKKLKRCLLSVERAPLHARLPSSAVSFPDSLLFPIRHQCLLAAAVGRSSTTGGTQISIWRYDKSHSFGLIVCIYTFRLHKDRLRHLLLLLELGDWESDLYGRLVRDAGVQRYRHRKRPRHIFIEPNATPKTAPACLSGKGIGKALMSKVAQVGKRSSRACEPFNV